MNEHIKGEKCLLQNSASVAKINSRLTTYFQDLFVSQIVCSNSLFIFFVCALCSCLPGSDGSPCPFLGSRASVFAQSFPFPRLSLRLLSDDKVMVGQLSSSPTELFADQF